MSIDTSLSPNQSLNSQHFDEILNKRLLIFKV